jgi:hypothetical protein
VDGADDGHRLTLWESAEPVAEPVRIATAFAQGLAACDFAPTAQGVSRARAEATLRAAGLR